MSVMDKIKSLFSGGSSDSTDDHAGHDHSGHDHDHSHDSIIEGLALAVVRLRAAQLLP